MSLTPTRRQVVSADVSLRVPRGEAGNLDSGVVDVLEAVDGVEAVELEHVSSVRPTWTDIHVDADVEIQLSQERLDGAADDGTTNDGTLEAVADDAVVELLEDGFGVTGVNSLE